MLTEIKEAELRNRAGKDTKHSEKILRVCLISDTRLLSIKYNLTDLRPTEIE